MTKEEIIESKLNEYFGEFWPGEHWDFTPDDLRRIGNFFYTAGLEDVERAEYERLSKKFAQQ